MKRTIVTLILLTLAFTFSSLAQGWRQNEMEVRVEIKDTYTSHILSELKLTGDYYPGHAVLYVTPKEADRLLSRGIDYTINIQDLNEHFSDFWEMKVDYHSYQEIVDLADSLVAAFPDICMKKMYGTSVQGRELAALKISDNVQEDENEAEVMFDGGIHGDEIGAAENCIRFARDLCRKYGNDPYVTDLIDDREIWIYYMVNPDGRENMSRYNANTVDLNRDYGYMWDAWGGSNDAFSQIETQKLRNCSFENQFVVHTAYHSGTEYVSCPWSYRSDNPSDAAHILQLAGIYSDSSGYPMLEYGQGNTGMYAINGSTKDGNYGTAGSISWSMEISHQKQPPASQLMQYYNWNYPSMLAMVEYAGYGLEGVVTDAVTGDPVRAVVFVNDFMQTYSDSTAGDYHKYVLPGNYSIQVVANGYETQVSADSITVTEFSSSVYDFQLTPVDTARWYAWRMISSHIPDNNPSDEGNTTALVGAPDSINYSIGVDGWCVVDMQRKVMELPGNDIKIYEGDQSPEGFSLYAGESMDGPWIYIGDGEGTTEFELEGTGVSSARYFKIVDDGDGPSQHPDAGFDLDAISDLDHIVGVFIVMDEYDLDDENGNNHLEQGETADLHITISNNGNLTAGDVQASLSTSNPYINITQGSANVGTLAQFESGNATFTFEVDEAAPTGDTVNFTIEVEANNGMYLNTFELMFQIGKYPVLILDLDSHNSSAPVMQDIINSLDISPVYVTSFPDNFDMYKCAFVCLGVYDNNYELSQAEGQELADYLENGGRLYMEGGDTWAYDEPTAVHPMFKIASTEDGSDDLGLILGQEGSFADGMFFQYEGDNSYIDRLVALDNAFELFRNQIPSYCNAVALDEGTYKTVGASFEFGGLTDGQHTKEELMILILEFFGGILTDIDEAGKHGSELVFTSWPNPGIDKVNFNLILEKNDRVKLDIYNLGGQHVWKVVDAVFTSGLQSFTWDGSSSPAGMYIYKLQVGNKSETGKIVLQK